MGLYPLSLSDRADFNRFVERNSEINSLTFFPTKL